MAASKQLSWNEIRSRAHAFVKEWRDESRERAEKDSFWNDFFHVFGVNRRRFVTFERNVTKLKGTAGFIDGFWPGMILVEHKSRGKDLDKALGQAQEYIDVLPQHELPRYVVISDFAEFRVWDMDENTRHAFPIEELPERAELFAPLAGYRPVGFEEEDAVNVKAAALLGTLHDMLDASGYTGHPLRMLLVRILFLLFADDTGVWEKSIFSDYLRDNTADDGRDLGMHLHTLFEVLDTPESKRQSSLDEALAQFPYINGDLFAERIPTASFDTAMRECLLNCSRFDWAGISPAIFGSMFQSVMDAGERRQIGAHYTTEQNILKLIDPLFLDNLRAEFTDITTLAPKRRRERLNEFKEKLGKLTFFDPACGCGNFLLIAYRELRLLELDVLKLLRDLEQKGAQQFTLDALAKSEVTVDQFYGIEVEEFPARIAQTAMYLMDHLMNQRLSQEFGLYYARFPIESSAGIVCGNALQMDWRDVLAPADCSYIMGNPPFVGKHLRSESQRNDMANVFGGTGFNVMDYVCAWFIKAAEYIEETPIRVAFVATNSITQGEQVSALWQRLYRLGCRIDFAHRTFNWTSEARGGAHVHVVIIGFSREGLASEKRLFNYERGQAAQEVTGDAISPYLTLGTAVFVQSSRTALSPVPPASYGSKPADGGHLILSDEEVEAIRSSDLVAAKYIRPLVSAHEMLSGKTRWCLWLAEADPTDIRQSSLLRARLEAVRDFRAASTKAATRELAATPQLFAEIRQPSSEWLAIPIHSSQTRRWLPTAFFSPDSIASNSVIAVSNATVFDFGILSSKMHLTWLAVVGGRIKSDFRYNIVLVYNPFPFPAASESQARLVEGAAQAVLDVRNTFPNASLASLYDPLAMPPALTVAHTALDRAVDAIYGLEKDATDADRMGLLLSRYEAMTAPLEQATASR